MALTGTKWTFKSTVSKPYSSSVRLNTSASTGTRVLTLSGFSNVGYASTGTNRKCMEVYSGGTVRLHNSSGYVYDIGLSDLAGKTINFTSATLQSTRAFEDWLQENATLTSGTFTPEPISTINDINDLQGTIWKFNSSISAPQYGFAVSHNGFQTGIYRTFYLQGYTDAGEVVNGSTMLRVLSTDKNNILLFNNDGTSTKISLSRLAGKYIKFYKLPNNSRAYFDDLNLFLPWLLANAVEKTSLPSSMGSKWPVYLKFYTSGTDFIRPYYLVSHVSNQNLMDVYESISPNNSNYAKFKEAASSGKFTFKYWTADNDDTKYYPNTNLKVYLETNGYINEADVNRNYRAYYDKAYAYVDSQGSHNCLIYYYDGTSFKQIRPRLKNGSSYNDWTEEIYFDANTEEFKVEE